MRNYALTTLVFLFVTTVAVASTPVVQSISPARGPINIPIVITGKNFGNFSKVEIGGKPAGSSYIDNGSTIRATVPSGISGSVKVFVTNRISNVDYTSEDIVEYTVLEKPMITNIDPGSELVNETVTIIGTGFIDGTTVDFGGVELTNVTIEAESKIRVKVPSTLSGPVKVKVKNDGGTSAPYSFTVIEPKPFIRDFSRYSAPVNTIITITGENFKKSSKVRFGTVDAELEKFDSANQIKVKVPDTLSETEYIVVVVNGYKVSDESKRFLVIPTPATPEVKSLSPESASVGKSIDIIGENFVDGAEVTFGGISSPNVKFKNQKLIQAEVPVGVPAVAQVVVIVDPIKSVEVVTFKRLTPTVKSITPSTGPVNTPVMIEGTNFDSDATVMIGGVPATATFVDDKHIQSIIPADARNDAAVVVANESVQSAGSVSFTVTATSAPSISTLSKDEGREDDEIIITGTNFIHGSTKVMFGDNEAKSVVVSGNTSLTAKVPAGRGNVKVNVQVFVDGVGSNTKEFRYLDIAPTLKTMVPESGSVAETHLVTITGTDFTDDTKVYFNNNVVTVTERTDTTLKFTAPQGQAAGDVDVYVETNGLKSEIKKFTYLPVDEFRITALTPREGPYTGGTTVVISGMNLVNITKVTFDGNDIAIDTVATGIQFTTPAGTVNKSVPVTVTNSAGKVSNEAHFLFTPLMPVISAITPNTGETTGNYTVDIVGSNLNQPNVEVYFKDTKADILSQSGTMLKVLVPPGNAGEVTITIKTPSGNATGLFTYYPEGVPTVSAITPSFGLLEGDTQVWLTGTGFKKAEEVTFDGKPAQFKIHSDVSISAVTPDLSLARSLRSTGHNVKIIVKNDKGTSAPILNLFTVHPRSVPVIESISPASGPVAGGNWVVLSGSGFTGVTAVTFGGVNAMAITGNSDSSISVQVPAGTGRVPVVVTSAGGTSAGKDYTYEGARPDPSQDPEVRGIVNAHVSTADRFIQLQSGSVGSRLTSIRRRGGSGMRSNSFNFRVNNSAPRIGRHERRQMSQQYSPVYSFNTTQAFPSIASQQMQSPWAFWSDGAVNIGTDKDEDGHDYTTYNLTLGADYAVESFAAGFALGYANDQSDVGDRGSETSGDAYTAVLYGSYTPLANFYLEGMLGYSHLSLDSHRYLGFNSGFVDGNRSGYQYFGTVAAGYDMVLGDLTLNPYGKFAWSRSTLKEYAESGAGNRTLRYGKTEIESYSTSLGLRAEYAVRQSWGTLLPGAGVEYTYNFKGGANTALGYVDQMGMPYSVSSRSTGRNQFSANVGVNAIVFNKYSLGMEYRGTFSGKQRDHRFSFQASWSY